MSNFDVIVIGAGLGGLSAASMLVNKGKKVLLLEQHSVVGGYATCWKREGIEVEGSLHEIDDIGKNSKKYKTLKSLGLKNVEFVKINELYKIVTKDLNITLPSNKEELIKFLKIRFPKEAQNIDLYFTTLENIYKELMLLMQPTFFTYLKMSLFPIFFKNVTKYEKISVKDFFDNCFSSDEIKTVLAANFGYYTDNINTLSILFFAVAQNSYYNGHGWFVKGGSQKLSNALANIVKDNNGTIITKALVTKILTKNKEVIGVEYKYKGEIKIAYSKCILNNASPIWAINALDNEKLKKDLIQTFSKNVEFSPSSTGVYLIVKGQKAPKNRVYSTFVYKNCSSLENMISSIYEQYENRSFNITDYGAIDSGLSLIEKRQISIFITDKYENWANLTREEYEAKKEEVGIILIKRAIEIYPDIKDNIISFEVATPLTNERYTKNSNGSIYGYAQNMNQSGRYRKKFHKIVPNLINASAWGMIGGGFSGTIYNGFIAAKEIK
jgi:phytoene dehydrogenase-like protein